MKLTLTPAELRTIYTALIDAASDREAFRQAHLESYPPFGVEIEGEVYIREHTAIVRRTLKILKDYEKLRVRILAECKKLRK